MSSFTYETSPILIAGNPRSGTSMTAGLVARHGVQVGQQRNPNAGNPKGGYENKPISDYLKSVLINAGSAINPCGKMIEGLHPRPDFAATVRSHIPDPSRPWLYKNFRILPTAILWREGFPNARYVLPVRNDADTLESMVKHHHIGRQGTREQLADWIKYSRERQEMIASRSRYFWFDVDRAWSGDLDHIADMLSFCGRALDTDILNDWVDRSLWHNRKGLAHVD